MQSTRFTPLWLRILTLLAIIAISVPAAAADVEEEPGTAEPVDHTETEWKDSIRDIYLEGELKRDLLTFSAREPRRMLLVDPADAAGWIVDLESTEVFRATQVEFEVEKDRVLAKVNVAQPAPESSASELGDNYLWLSTPAGRFVLGSHQGIADEIDAETLFSVAPAWKRLYDAYTPDEEVVAELKEIESPTEFTLAFGTWCGDSRREVPKMLKTLDAADNSNLKLKLVSLGRGFLQPATFIREAKLTNVPTLVVEEAARERGRLVERPRSEGFPTDLTAMLEGKPHPVKPPSDALFEIARGRYRVLDVDGSELGTESFAISALKSGGREYRSTRDDEDGTTDVRQRVAEDGTTEFIEITRRGVAHSRTRVNARNGSVSLLTRGERTGIVRQSLTPEPGTALVSPNWTGHFLHWIEAGRPDAPLESPALMLGGSSSSPAATPAEIRFRAEPTTARKIEGIERPIASLQLHSSKGRVQADVDSEWGVPYSASRSDGVRLELVSFASNVIPSDAKDSAP